MPEENKTTPLWSPALALGIPLIDGQHKNLIERLDALLKALAADRPAHHEVRQCLAFVEKYTQEHFQTEERYMALHAFPGLAVHQELHRDFQTKVARARRFIEANSRSDQSEQLVRSLLYNWYVHHIRGADQEYTAFFRDQAVSDLFK